MKWLTSLTIAIGLACNPAFAQELTSAPASISPSHQQRDAFVTDLLKKMTLEEKIGQLRLISVGTDNPKEAIREMIRNGQVGAIFNTVTRPDIRAMQDQVMQLSRLKIPLFFAYDVVHGQRTIFPIALGLASSWDMDAIAKSARVAAYEATEDGLNMTWAPMVDITRDPRWGRVSEGFGEDTWLTSKIAGVVVKSFQGDDVTGRHSLMTSVKHYALYGAVEGGRDYNTVDMSPQRMFQDYMPPYKAAIDAGSSGVMVALNSINGTPATSNSWLLKEVLRDQWNFKGITITDHGAIKELIKHGVASDPRDASRLAVKSGIGMSMSDEYFVRYLPELVKSGAVSVQEIDDACRQVLNVKYDMGLFEDPYRHLGPVGSDPVDTNAESRLHRLDARDVARKSLVLLKNRLQTLPLKKEGTIAVVGPLADSQRDTMGSWSAAGVTKQTITVYQGLKNAVGDKATILYAKGANVSNHKGIIDFLNQYEDAVQVDKRPPQVMIDEAVAAAKKADVVVAVVGEAAGMAHEASSRSNIDLPQGQRDLIAALKATGKPLVLVLMNGRPLALVREDQQADALLETWFSGTEGGNAIADVLFGDYNPSGKLPMSFPRSVGQIPIYYNHLPSGRPYTPENPGKYTSHYYDEANGPLYPFGYGLSYTTFSVSDVRLSSQTMKRNGTINASVTVKNTGSRAGETVVQLYVHDVVASISRPLKELRGFEKVMLQPGESRTVTFTLDQEALKFYNARMQQVVEPGKFDVMIGLDSQRVKSDSFTLL
ncbi:beta-glucosidase BglX [Pectobacterium carotovorum]|uniref:beta-glucosidase BglX n=1 Tax=Pectobacterium carotovorum TaxID=554 RepID=UPI000503414C|nr:beta-glucosidase BglX [Pectobacterium carotovorum]QQK72602.1 beta-glucosidase BglX [Pectobacterium versatile]KAA3667592.1 beta-glucosidase BglX [Pectobacterium carotovorum subsp. carotovorum]KFW97716.1 beta-D-glucoside glucohydrolase [Pectobacterium carotovorum subsp. carotovorum]KHS86543.1 beta-D-glucoside glucohydrolase [Pectobacterium carotovorum subsp. carotovorum]KHT21701.1 beta-D-glucoside glucohydrolase [Pectobacterium carotovorum subsp. carotovorum]